MIVTAYTDGSHRYPEMVGACGFVAIVEGRMIKHQIVFIETGSTFLCEFIAIINALQYSFLLNDVTRIIIRTDCRAALHYAIRGVKRKKREAFFITEFIDTLDIIREHSIEVGVEYVKAHSNDKYNTFIDSSARSQLKKYLNNKNHKNEKCNFKECHPVTYYRSVNRL